MKKLSLKKSFLLFIMYSMVGWILEVLLALVCLRKFVNRGFLIGPYLPIYGIGCIFLVLFLERYKDKPLLLIICSMLICSLLEYITSVLLELAFNTRWWDYSNNLINLNGRICLETTIIFGIMGAIIIYVVNPFFVRILENLPVATVNILFYVLAIIFITDCAISFTSATMLRDTYSGTLKDTTEQTSKKVIRFIRDIFGNIKAALV